MTVCDCCFQLDALRLVELLLDHKQIKRLELCKTCLESFQDHIMAFPRVIPVMIQQKHYKRVSEFYTALRKDEK